MMNKKLLIALIGKSGSGKSTIATRLEHRFNFVQARSFTTRPMRDDPNDALTHTFITPDQVAHYKDDIVAYNVYNGYEYFATRQLLNDSQIYVVDREGLIQLYRNYLDKDILSIYINCNSSVVAKRMQERGDSDESIMRRLQYDAKAFEGVEDLCDFSICNDENNGVNNIVDWIEGLYRYYKVRERVIR